MRAGQESLTGFRTNELMKLESIQEFLRKRKEREQESQEDDREIQRLMNIGSSPQMPDQKHCQVPWQEWEIQEEYRRKCRERLLTLKKAWEENEMNRANRSAERG
jgi:hypothetical protein